MWAGVVGRSSRYLADICGGATRSRSLPDNATISAAELEGAFDVIAFLLAYYQGHDLAQAFFENHCSQSSLNYSDIRSLVLADLVC